MALTQDPPAPPESDLRVLLTKAQSELGTQAHTIAVQALAIESARAQLRASELHAQNVARQVEAESRRLNAVLEATPVGIFVTDAHGRLISTNPANQTFWGVGQPQVGSPIELSKWTGWWVEDARRARSVHAKEWPMARALKGEHIAGETLEVLSFHEPPVARTVLMSAAPIVDKTQQIIGGVTTVMDITDRIKAEQSLRESDRRKDEFLAMLAHELRNPLAPIRAAADMLAMASDESDRLRKDRIRQTSAVIVRQVRHLTAMVDDLLDVSRVTRGLVKLEQVTLDIGRVILDAVEQVRPLAQAKHHRLKVHTPPEPVYVKGDAKRLVQVLTNLLTNAVKYTPSPGWIQITLEAQNAQACITVKDNGIGMSPELVKTAFDLFTQAQRASDRAQGGLGIGLALVRRLVELHEGQVEAHSDGVGRGSSFVVTLPRITQVSADESVAVEAAAPQILPQAAPSKALKVLVVDDNVDAAQMLALLVETLGHHAVIEHSASAALARAAADSPDVCLLDIGLPEVDGYELARRLRAQAVGHSPYLVAVTGYGQPQDLERTQQAGFDHHLVKPADTDALARLLNQLGAQKGPA